MAYPMSKCDIIIIYDGTNQLCFRNRHDLIAVQSVIKSVIAVQAALTKNHYRTSVIGIKTDLYDFIQTIKRLNPKCIFNLCESIFGRSIWESNIPVLLDFMGIPYTGSDGNTLTIALNKAKSKEFLRSHGLPVPNYAIFHDEAVVLPPNLGFPLIIKPLQEDGSMGITTNSVVKNFTQFKKQISRLLSQGFQPLIAEEYIDGRELNLGILGNENYQLLPISEIDFSTLPPKHPRILTYNSKWKTNSPEYRNTRPIIPAKLGGEIQKKVEAVAMKAYTLLHCRDYARIDLRLSRDNIPYIIEVNPNPDISPDAGMVRAAMKAGLGYEDLIMLIVENAISRGKRIKTIPSVHTSHRLYSQLL